MRKVRASLSLAAFLWAAGVPGTARLAVAAAGPVPADTPSAVYRDLKAAWLDLRERFLDARIAARFDTEALGIRLQRLEPPPPANLRKAFDFLAGGAVSFNQLREELGGTYQRESLPKAMRRLIRDFRLSSDEERDVIARYQPLSWVLGQNSIRWDEKAQVFRTADGRPLGDDAIRKLRAASPPRDSPLDKGRLEAALAPLQDRLGAGGLDPAGLEGLMDGSRRRDADAASPPTRTGNAGVLPAKAPPSVSGAAGAPEPIGAGKDPDAAADAALSSAWAGGALPMAMALYRSVPLPGLARSLAADGLVSGLARAPGVTDAGPDVRLDEAGRLRPGTRFTLKDGSAMFVSRDGMTAVETPDGRAAVRDPVAGSYVEYADHRILLKWRRGADGRLRGSFRGRPFVSSPEDVPVLSPDRTALYFQGRDAAGRPVPTGAVTEALRKRCLDSSCRTYLSYVAGSDGLRRVHGLDPAALSRPDGGDWSGLPAAALPAPEREAYRRLLAALPRLSPGFAPLASGGIAAAELIDGRLHLRVRTERGGADLTAQLSGPPEARVLEAVWSTGNGRMLWRCDAETAAYCDRFVEAGSGEGRVRWRLVEGWTRSPGAMEWARGGRRAGAVSEWSWTQEAAAEWEGILGAAGALLSPAAAAVESIYHFGSAATHAAAAAAVDDAFHAAYFKLMARYSLSESPAARLARAASSAAGYEEKEPVARYRAALAGLDSAQKRLIELFLDDQVLRGRMDSANDDLAAMLQSEVREQDRAEAALSAFGQANVTRQLLESEDPMAMMLGAAGRAGEMYAQGHYSGLLARSVLGSAASPKGGAVPDVRQETLSRRVSTLVDSIDGTLGGAGTATRGLQGLQRLAEAQRAGDAEDSRAALAQVLDGAIGTGFFAWSRFREDGKKTQLEELEAEAAARKPLPAPPVSQAGREQRLREAGDVLTKLLADDEVAAAVAKVASHVSPKEFDPAAIRKFYATGFKRVPIKVGTAEQFYDPRVAGHFDPVSGEIVINPAQMGRPAESLAILLAHELAHSPVLNVGELGAWGIQRAITRAALARNLVGPDAFDGDTLSEELMAPRWQREIMDRYFADEESFSTKLRDGTLFWKTYAKNPRRSDDRWGVARYGRRPHGEPDLSERLRTFRLLKAAEDLGLPGDEAGLRRTVQAMEALYTEKLPKTQGTGPVAEKHWPSKVTEEDFRRAVALSRKHGGVAAARAWEDEQLSDVRRDRGGGGSGVLRPDHPAAAPPGVWTRLKDFFYGGPPLKIKTRKRPLGSPGWQNIPYGEEG